MFALCPLIILFAQFYLINVKLVVMMNILMDISHPPVRTLGQFYTCALG